MPGEDLARFVQEVTGERYLRVDEDLGGGFVRLRPSEADRRQARQDIRCSEDVVLELLRNARDAGAHLICVATRREGSRREIAVVDDGCGVPPEMWERIFEPRVTSRLDSFHADQWGVHGRGMALFSVACNAEEARVVSSGRGLGTAVRVVADAARLPERADQSTLPHLHVAEDGRRVMRGPRNVNRIVAEFTIGLRGGCLVYLGSPIQVLSTLVAHGAGVLSQVERAFAADPAAYPLCLRPALAATPDELAQAAAALGMPVSSRSARRILSGEVELLAPFASAIGVEDARGDRGADGGHARSARRRRVHVSEDDLAAFADGVSRAYAGLAAGYYLDAAVKPRVRVARDGLHVFVPFADQEEGGA